MYQSNHELLDERTFRIQTVLEWVFQPVILQSSYFYSVDINNEIILEKHHVHLKMTSFLLNCKKFFDCKKMPNEIWLKIMSYSNTKDLIKNLALVCKHDFSKFPQWIYEFWIAHLDIIPSQIDCTNWNNLIFSREIKKSFLQPRKKAI